MTQTLEHPVVWEDLEFEIPCDHVEDDCPLAATWSVSRACCDMVLLLCDLHTLKLRAFAQMYWGLTCGVCGSEVFFRDIKFDRLNTGQ